MRTTLIILFAMLNIGCFSQKRAAVRKPAAQYVTKERFDSLLLAFQVLSEDIRSVKKDSIYLKSGEGGFDGDGSVNNPLRVYEPLKAKTRLVLQK